MPFLYTSTPIGSTALRSRLEDKHFSPEHTGGYAPTMSESTDATQTSDTTGAMNVNKQEENLPHIAHRTQSATVELSITVADISAQREISSHPQTRPLLEQAGSTRKRSEPEQVQLGQGWWPAEAFWVALQPREPEGPAR